MGDAGRNTIEVGKAVACLTDRDRMCMANSKITISTVGPSPETFSEIAAMPGTIAWSLHSSDDTIRKKLVPSTKHTTVELRDGLLKALETRKTMNARTIMIALTLINDINDSTEDALKLVEFIKPMLLVSPKIAIDLIPYNDINVEGFAKPSKEKVNSFQRVIRENGLFCSVRVTRGDAESSACGMLVTKKVKANIVVK
jgi:23S rRNA (adenine2503-C2)-methyltransferase